MEEKNIISDKTKLIRDMIALKFPSVRAFARASGIPHGTVVSALNNGIEGMAWGTVMKMCECLHIDGGTFEPIIDDDTVSVRERRLLAYYFMLDDKGKEKVLEYIKDIS